MVQVGTDTLVDSRLVRCVFVFFDFGPRTGLSPGAILRCSHLHVWIVVHVPSRAERITLLNTLATPARIFARKESRGTRRHVINDSLGREMVCHLLVCVSFVKRIIRSCVITSTCTTEVRVISIKRWDVA